LLRWYLSIILPRLNLTLDPPDLCLLNSWDYRCELSHWSLKFFKRMGTLSLRKFSKLQRSIFIQAWGESLI
jgi:hypothetical protein